MGRALFDMKPFPKGTERRPFNIQFCRRKWAVKIDLIHPVHEVQKDLFDPSDQHVAHMYPVPREVGEFEPVAPNDLVKVQEIDYLRLKHQLAVVIQVSDKVDVGLAGPFVGHVCEVSATHGQMARGRTTYEDRQIRCLENYLYFVDNLPDLVNQVGAALVG